MDTLGSARRPIEDRPQRDSGHLELLEARYNHLRAFTPAVLAALPLAGGPVQQSPRRRRDPPRTQRRRSAPSA